MSNVNTCAVSGNVVRDAEIVPTKGEKSIVRFTVAVDENVKNKQTGEWETRPNFFDCVLFTKSPEGIAARLTKGALVFVGGSLRWSQWETGEGGKRSKVEIAADQVRAFPRGERAQGAPARPAPALYDEDVPF